MSERVVPFVDRPCDDTVQLLEPPEVHTRVFVSVIDADVVARDPSRLLIDAWILPAEGDDDLLETAPNAADAVRLPLVDGRLALRVPEPAADALVPDPENASLVVRLVDMDTAETSALSTVALTAAESEFAGCGCDAAGRSNGGVVFLAALAAAYPLRSRRRAAR